MAKRARKKATSDFQNLVKLPWPLVDFFTGWLHIDKDDLVVVQHLAEQNGLYREMRIPKGKRGERILFVPIEELKAVQRKILDHALSFIPVHFAAYGCRDGVSFIEGARQHAGFAQSLYSLDLRHAFPSVTRRRVEVHLTTPLAFQIGQFGLPLTEEEITLAAQSVVDLVVFRNSIPQGAPTSPAMLNIVCRNLDRRITEFLVELEKNGRKYRYTRYVDDLTISADREDGLDEKDRAQIKKIIVECGFHPHPAKERYVPIVGKRQTAEVTGVRIHPDGRLTLSKRALNAYRARLHKAVEIAGQRKLSAEERGEVNGVIGYLRQVYGEQLPSAVRKTVEEVLEALRR